MQQFSLIKIKSNEKNINRIVSEIEEKDYPSESEYKNTLVISRLKQVVKGNSWIQDREKRFYNFIKKIVI